MGGRRAGPCRTSASISAAPFGKNKEPAYLAMNPNGLVPTLRRRTDSCCGNRTRSSAISPPSIGAGTLEPADLRSPRARAPMDGLAADGARPGDHAGVLGPDPHAAGEARPQARSTPARSRPRRPRRSSMPSSARPNFVAGNAFSIGDIPVGVMSYRYRELVPERPALANFERWYAAIAERPAFRDHVSSIPLT